MSLSISPPVSPPRNRHKPKSRGSGVCRIATGETERQVEGRSPESARPYQKEKRISADKRKHCISHIYSLFLSLYIHIYTHSCSLSRRSCFCSCRHLRFVHSLRRLIALAFSFFLFVCTPSVYSCSPKHHPVLIAWSLGFFSVQCFGLFFVLFVSSSLSSTALLVIDF